MSERTGVSLNNVSAAIEESMDTCSKCHVVVVYLSSFFFNHQNLYKNTKRTRLFTVVNNVCEPTDG
jgi:hypothetical protein